MYFVVLEIFFKEASLNQTGLLIISVIIVMYKFIRFILFRFDPEKVHSFSMNILKRLCNIGFVRSLLKSIFNIHDEKLTMELFGLVFKNPVGLAAGFDKNAKYLRELALLGFGCVEIGTITPLPQAGNDKPRLFRLIKDKALINRMGFNNDGAEAVAKRLKVWRTISEIRDDKKNARLIIGGNIGINKTTSSEHAWMDYTKCFECLFEYVDYFVVNVSSPNTPKLRELQEKEALKKILIHLQALNNQKPHPKPLLLKISPDLTYEQIDDVITVALEVKLDGLVVANTTVNREGLRASRSQLQKIGLGGLSGKPLKKISTEILIYVHQKVKGQIPLVASGGIFTANDAKEKLSAGASLVQVWTGFIYEGPSIVKKICRGLMVNSAQKNQRQSN